MQAFLTSVGTVILTFLFMGFVGNWLVQRWQQRNWVDQQRFLGEQKHYENVAHLCDEIVDLSGRRVWRMRRLLASLSPQDQELIRRRLAEYDEVLSEWNAKLIGFNVRLTYFAAYEMVTRLEHEVQSRFVELGSELERLVKQRLARGASDRRSLLHLEYRLNSLSGSVSKYNRDLLSMAEIQKTKTYYGRQIPLNSDTLQHFPTWELIKGLFKPRIQPHTIVRSPTDLRAPFGSGNPGSGVD